jgi:hypothetical protein
MSHLKQYEDAIVSTTRSYELMLFQFFLRIFIINSCWIKTVASIRVILKTLRWKQMGTVFEDIDKLIEDEVIVVTDANYRFASQNMKKMNGYLPKEVLVAQKCFKVRVQIALFRVK